MHSYCYSDKFFSMSSHLLKHSTHPLHTSLFYDSLRNDASILVLTELIMFENIEYILMGNFPFSVISTTGQGSLLFTSYLAIFLHLALHFLHYFYFPNEIPSSSNANAEPVTQFTSILLHCWFFSVNLWGKIRYFCQCRRWMNLSCVCLCPMPCDFFKKCMIDVSRQIWVNAELFMNSVHALKFPIE